MRVEQARELGRKTYLLLCLVTGSRPFRDDVLLGLGVCGEGESYAREGGTLRERGQQAEGRPGWVPGGLTKSIPTISWALERPSPATSAMRCWL